MQNKWLLFTCTAICAGLMNVNAQSDDTEASRLLMEAQVTGLRASSGTPTSFQNIDSTFLQRFDSGKDLPMVLQQTPSLVSTSDAGAGVGYTGMRIRGSDATRINVTMNGIPLNDSESQGVFWVNTPDLVSSLKSIQIQRGVGSSTNGAGAFGASVNMNTLGNSQKASSGYTLGAGSFNTWRQTFKASTGMFGNGWSLDLRLSDLRSDGYIDRASSDLQGYFAQLNWKGTDQNLQFIAYGGREVTYQAWYGLDGPTMETDRTTNYAGALYGIDGSINYYDDETDNYGQDHYQLHYGKQFSSNSHLTAALHYTGGKGYYEQYRQNDVLSNYGLPAVVIGGDTLAETDLIRRLWLDNHFYGAIAQYSWKKGSTDLDIGGGFHRYEGDHYGDLQWMRFASSSELRDRFYSNRSVKNDGNIYIKWKEQLGEKWSTYVDLQLRSVDYSGNGTDEGDLPVAFDDQLLFFNPKAGVQYTIASDKTAYLSYAVAHREGNRVDYLYGTPKPEQLHDIELGFKNTEGDLSYSANAYFMFYRDQLVLTGEIDNVGGFIRRNVGKSQRIGLEFEGNYRFNERWNLALNAAFSSNQNVDFRILDNSQVLQDAANTPLPYSPSIVAGSVISYSPIQALAFSMASRFVGKQYLSNENNEAHVLPSYFLNDLRIQYSAEKFPGKPVLSLDIFNLFDELYASNGYVYAGTPYFYPQAGTHWMTTLSISL